MWCENKFHKVHLKGMQCENKFRKFRYFSSLHAKIYSANIYSRENLFPLRWWSWLLYLIFFLRWRNFSSELLCLNFSNRSKSIFSPSKKYFTIWPPLLLSKPCFLASSEKLTSVLSVYCKTSCLQASLSQTIISMLPTWSCGLLTP